MTQGRAATVQVLGSDGQISRREIVIGLDDKVSTEVLAGLSEGEAVVTGEGAGRSGGSSGGSGRMMGRGGPPMGL
ncbi:hypothetical protein QWZ10_03080 [Paracoccus cavernae]|uniref:Multidrug resistance protein MdtA-like C-terminal permuted SH3 domain-containing protein n=1 Tax=Paracoccus cavernae TaxID=1571207 RepID=A0ABT8D3S6_9RHOB|nr:hypothetical protein [Paracoccus cavernae]